MTRCLAVIIGIIWQVSIAGARSDTAVLIERMANSGHRNIGIIEQNENLEVYYWPLGFRDEYIAFLEAKRIASRWLNEQRDGAVREIKLVQTSWGIPFVASEIKRNGQSKNLFRINYGTKVASRNLWHKKNVLLQFDIPLRANFGEPYDPLVFKTGIRPDLRFILAPGCVAFGQIDLYVRNEYIPSQWFEPANIGLLYAHSLKEKTISVTNIGLFQRELYGIDEELRTSFFDDTISAGFRCGFFGTQRLRNNRIEYYRMYKWLAIADISWTWTKYDCRFGARAGRFMYGDEGYGLEVSRIFGETEIGFRGIRSGPDIIATINTRIPLFPTTRKIRASRGIGLVNAVRFSYRYDSRGMEPRTTPYYRAYEPEVGISFHELQGLTRVTHFRSR